jgi:hypothetical protein
VRPLRSEKCNRIGVRNGQGYHHRNDDHEWGPPLKSSLEANRSIMENESPRDAPLQQLLLDDQGELPIAVDEAEAALAANLGPIGLRRIDDNLRRQAVRTWLKVARVVVKALDEGGFQLSDEATIRLHTRRVIALVESGELESQGNLRRPRWSEVRLPP